MIWYLHLPWIIESNGDVPEVYTMCSILFKPLLFPSHARSQGICVEFPLYPYFCVSGSTQPAEGPWGTALHDLPCPDHLSVVITFTVGATFCPHLSRASVATLGLPSEIVSTPFPALFQVPSCALVLIVWLQGSFLKTEARTLVQTLHVMQEETGVQVGWVLCPRAHSVEQQEGIRPESLNCAGSLCSLSVMTEVPTPSLQCPRTQPRSTDAGWAPTIPGKGKPEMAKWIERFKQKTSITRKNSFSTFQLILLKTLLLLGGCDHTVFTLSDLISCSSGRPSLSSSHNWPHVTYPGHVDTSRCLLVLFAFLEYHPSTGRNSKPHQGPLLTLPWGTLLLKSSKRLLPRCPFLRPSSWPPV